MSEPLSSTHNNQTQNSHQNTMSEEQEQTEQILAECKIEEPEETQETHEILSDDGGEFADNHSSLPAAASSSISEHQNNINSNDQSDHHSESGRMDLSPHMMEVLIQPYVRRHNEVKSTLIQALQNNHAAMNIARISRKYIYCLYGMIENITGNNTSQNALKLLRDEAYAHEEQLRHWENMYNGGDIEHSLMQAINEPSPAEPKSNGLSSASSSAQMPRSIPKTLSRVTELAGRSSSYHQSSHQSKQSNGGSNQNDSREDSFNNMHPVEMLELSMQTSSQDHLEHSDYEDDDEMNHHNQQNDSQYGALQSLLNEDLLNNIQKQASLRSSEQSQNMLGDKRPSFPCQFEGCNYSTHNRQRLNMHQKGHTGTPLFYCDIEGCGYLSNFKGNIKIHKRHKHKDDGASGSGFDGGESSPGKSRMSRKRKLPFDSSNPLFSDGLAGSNSNDQMLNDATLESSSNDSKKEKNDEMSICRFDHATGNYVCQWPSCGWITRWKQLVEPHALGHTGMKPYKCDVPGCDYQTNYKGNVKLHKKKHIKERYYQFQQEEESGSYKCDITGCDFRTVWKNSFEQHQRNHLRNTATSGLNNSNNINHHSHQQRHMQQSNNHHSSNHSNSEPSPRVMVIARPQDPKNPTKISIVTKPIGWKDSQGNNELRHDSKKSHLSSPHSDRDHVMPKKESLSSSLQTEGTNEYSSNAGEGSSHSNSPDPGEDYDDEDDELQYLGSNSYGVDKPSTSSRQFIVNNSHC